MIIGSRLVARACCSLLAAFVAAPLAAQPAGLLPQTPDPAADEIYPRVRLTYYTGNEGGRWQEIDFINLTEWTPDKDVYLQYGWANPAAQRRRAEPGVRRLFEAPENERVWRVRYEPAGVEGTSRLFITGYGTRNGQARIYHDRDFLSFMYIGNTGWYEFGAAARIARQFQVQQPNASSSAPLPTRSQ